MCFVIDEDHPNKKKATKNINCYKVLFEVSGSFRSVHRRFDYEPGEHYVEDGTVSLNIIGKNVIHFGFHSWTTVEEAIKLKEFYDLSDADDNVKKHMIVVECKIPKGANYYISKMFKEYVSDEIIIGKKEYKQ